MSEQFSIPDLLELAEIKELLQRGASEAKKLANARLNQLVLKYPSDLELRNLLDFSFTNTDAYFDSDSTTENDVLKNPLTLIRQGVIELDKGNISTAYSVFKKATEQYPEYALTWLWLAVTTPTLKSKRQILQTAACAENSVSYIEKILQVLEIAEENWPVNQITTQPLSQTLRKRVLIVDLVNEVRQAIESFFEMLDWEVYAAADLLSATKIVAKLWQNEFLTLDIIICADNLPYLGAITFFELLKDNLVYCAKPFIIKSVNGPILPYNFDAAIVWPASNQEIQTALNRWITV